jgi:hypothetical protein
MIHPNLAAADQLSNARFWRKAVVRGLGIPLFTNYSNETRNLVKMEVSIAPALFGKRKIDPALFGVGLQHQSALLYFVGDSVSANFAGKPAHRAL